MAATSYDKNPILTSRDGLKWVGHQLPFSNGRASNGPGMLCYAESIGGWVLLNSSPYISLDGDFWKKAPNFPLTDQGYATDMAYSEKQKLLVISACAFDENGINGAVITSSDGIHWDLQVFDFYKDDYGPGAVHFSEALGWLMYPQAQRNIEPLYHAPIVTSNNGKNWTVSTNTIGMLPLPYKGLHNLIASNG